MSATTAWIKRNAQRMTDASDAVWKLAETRYLERESAPRLAAELEKDGFDIEHGIADIPTAFCASYGDSKPVIGVLGEYDALPGLSQSAVPHRSPREEGAPGHGCAHNLLGVASLGAVLAVKAQMVREGLAGTIRFYGCPAEEGGAAKAFMAKAGVFDDIDIALTWHPGAANDCTASSSLARVMTYFRFHGTTAHAAGDPHNGRSALDAVELTNVGCNYLREHIIPEARLHYIITNGGLAPNVVPDLAEVQYLIRAPRADQLAPIHERVREVARGAAQMTGTELEIIFHSGASNVLVNDAIAEVFYEQMTSIDPPTYTDEEFAFAAEIAKTFPADYRDSFHRQLGPVGPEVVDQLENRLIADMVLPLGKSDKVGAGSTDVGDVSWVVPTGQFRTACKAIGTPGHSWQTTAQSGMSIGQKGMLYAAKVLGGAALRYLTDATARAAARAEFDERIRRTPYVSPIPDGAKPPLEPYQP